MKVGFCRFAGWFCPGQVWLLFLAAIMAQQALAGPRELLQQKQYEAARLEIRAEIARGNVSLDNWLMLGIACAAVGSDSEAQEAYREALKLKPDIPVALYNLAILALHAERWSESVGYLRHFAAVEPNDTEARFALVHALAKSGRVAEGYEEVGRILRSESGPEVYLRAAGLLTADGLRDQSEQVLEKAHALWPTRLDIKLKLSQQAAALGHYERVVEVLSDTTANDDSRVHQMLGESLFRLKRYGEAISNFQIAAKNLPSESLAQVFDMLILSHAALGQMSAVQQVAEESERRLGSRETTTLALANLLQLQKRDPEAISLLERHRMQFSRSGEYLFTLALAYHNAGDETQALEILNRVTALAPKLHQARYLIGMSLASLGDFAGAAKQLKCAIEIAPAHFLYHFELGILLSRTMQKGEAEQSLSRSIELNPNHAPAHYELAKIYSDSGRMEPALSELQKALKLKPEDESSLYLLSKVYAKLGRMTDAEAARQSFQRLQEVRLQERREQHQVAQAGGVR
jgi:tetratricopeptide (TPR) repeat protein